MLNPPSSVTQNALANVSCHLPGASHVPARCTHVWFLKHARELETRAGQLGSRWKKPCISQAWKLGDPKIGTVHRVDALISQIRVSGTKPVRAMLLQRTPSHCEDAASNIIGKCRFSPKDSDTGPQVRNRTRNKLM